MSKFINKSATINKTDHSGINTHGMSCIIDSWDNKIKKYKVDFDGGWCGWYKRCELIIDK